MTGYHHINRISIEFGPPLDEKDGPIKYVMPSLQTDYEMSLN